MKVILDQHPQVLEMAEEAIRRAGLNPQRASIRGGTDGARLSFMGLPTPNLFTGGTNFHAKTEWIALEDMQKAFRGAGPAAAAVGPRESQRVNASGRKGPGVGPEQQAEFAGQRSVKRRRPSTERWLETQPQPPSRKRLALLKAKRFGVLKSSKRVPGKRPPAGAYRP